MFALVSNAIAMGMTAAQILGFVSKKVKGIAKGIEQARGSGYNDDDILKFISGKMPKGKHKEVQEKLSDQQAYLKSAGLKTKEEKQESRRKGINTAFAIGSTALAGYGLYNQYAKRFPKGEWDFSRHPPEQEQLKIGGGAQPQLEYNPGLEKGPQGPNQFQMMPGAPIQPPQQMMKQAKQPGINPVPNAPAVPQVNPQQPAMQKPNPKDLLEQMGFLQKADTMLNAGNDPRTVSGALISLANPEMKQHLKKPETQQQIHDAVQEYAQSLKQGPQNAPVQNQQAPIEEIPQVAQGQENNGESAELRQPDADQEAAEAPTKSNVVSLPNGEVGTIKDLKKDHAVVEVNGKDKPVKLDQLEYEPKDVEEAVRHVINSIPEKEKSSAMESAIHVPIPGLNLMIVKFFDGKIAWYKDVDENLYDNIAKGNYSPKGEKRTGIAEYKPGVVDSRGAGFSEEIKNNAKYKDKKGEMWGYAKNEYDLWKTLQPIINKISKEEYDEKGNLIIKSKKPKKR